MSELKTDVLTVKSESWQIEARILKEIVKLQEKRTKESKVLSLYIYDNTPMFLSLGDCEFILGQAEQNPKLKTKQMRLELPLLDCQFVRTNYGECNTIQDVLKEFDIRKVNSRTPITIVPNFNKLTLTFLFKNKGERAITVPFRVENEPPNTIVFTDTYDVSITLEPETVFKMLKKMKTLKYCKFEVQIRDEKTKIALKKPTFRYYLSLLSNSLNLFSMKCEIDVDDISFSKEFEDTKRHLPNKITTVVSTEKLGELLNIVPVAQCKIMIEHNDRVRIAFKTKYNKWFMLLMRVVNVESEDVFQY